MNRLTIVGQLLVFAVIGTGVAWVLSHLPQIERALLRRGFNFIDLGVAVCVALAFWPAVRAWQWPSRDKPQDKSRPWEEVHRD